MGRLGGKLIEPKKKNPPAACLVQKQNNGSHQKISKNSHSKHTESIEFFIKKVAKMTTFRLVIYIFSMTNR